ncbi:hypothetical protein D9758_019106 [Tetrapyrgos nigripes]|uniref:Uncharacterized protein n=1 Tax=Tetrapyrgos nigripes TaxID=182062 RepID=A0A8H5ERE8_9AGAR|nr:hypothetical protein D9758_019106 [Tetrapyrgos nigripes]
MALAWPWLQQLKLECLGQNGPDHTSLWAVFAFTRLCPHLAYLKLSIDTAPLDTPPFIASSLPTQAEIAQAAALETLDFGYDPMRLGYDDEFVLAELLGKILPPRCSLLWEFSSDYDEDRLEDQLEDDRAQINRWLAVEKLFPRFAELYLKINQLKKRLLFRRAVDLVLLWWFIHVGHVAVFRSHFQSYNSTL